MNMYGIWKTIRVSAITAVLATSTVAAATAADTLKFIEGAPPTITMTDIYVAEAAKFFEEEGLSLPVDFAPNGAVATQMVASNQGDIGDVTMEAYLSGFEKGMRGKFIASRGAINTYFITVPANSDIKTFKDLEGKKIGVLSMGSQAIFYFKSMAREAGIDPEADMFLPVGFGDSAVAALKSGQVQALGLVNVAIASILTAPDEFRYIFHPTVADAGNYGYFVSDETLATKRAQIVKYLRALIKADIFIRENPKAALAIYWAKHPDAKPAGSDEEAVSLGTMRLNFDPHGIGTQAAPARIAPLNNDALTRMISVLRTEGMIHSELTAADVIDTSLFEEASKGVDAEAVKKTAREWK